MHVLASVIPATNTSLQKEIAPYKQKPEEREAYHSRACSHFLSMLSLRYPSITAQEHYNGSLLMVPKTIALRFLVSLITARNPSLDLEKEVEFARNNPVKEAEFPRSGKYEALWGQLAALRVAEGISIAEIGGLAISADEEDLDTPDFDSLGARIAWAWRMMGTHIKRSERDREHVTLANHMDYFPEKCEFAIANNIFDIGSGVEEERRWWSSNDRFFLGASDLLGVFSNILKEGGYAIFSPFWMCDVDGFPSTRQLLPYLGLEHEDFAAQKRERPNLYPAFSRGHFTVFRKTTPKLELFPGGFELSDHSRIIVGNDGVAVRGKS